jgi:carbon-monoxide dehydrogenase medium subunit
MSASGTSVPWLATFASLNRMPIRPRSWMFMKLSLLCKALTANDAWRSKIFFTDYYETALEKNEMLTDIDIPKLPDNFRGSYLRFCPGEWPIVTVALLTRWADGACAEARLGLGCVGPRPIRVDEFEKAVRGKSGDELAAKADGLAGIAAQISDPLADLWGSVEYKRQIVKNLVRDVLRSQCDGRG